MPLVAPTHYVTNGPWGAGKGVEHTPAEADEIFHILNTDVQTAITGVRGLGIQTITEVAGEFVFTLDDAAQTSIPIPLPEVKFLGEWLPATNYYPGRILRVSGLGLVWVMLTHLSAATFNIDAHVDGFKVYRLMYRDSGFGALINLAGTTRTLQAGDGYIRALSDSPVTITIPEVSPFSVTSEIKVRQQGNGVVTTVAGGATILHGKTGFTLSTGSKGDVVYYKKVADAEWDVWGDLAAV